MAPTDHPSRELSLLENTIFGTLPAPQLGDIAGAAQELTIPAGTVLFRQGDPGNGMYIISNGRIRVFLTSQDGVETDLDQLEPGNCFGEMALLTGEARSASVQALEETHLLWITKEEFDRVRAAHPDISTNAIKHMANLLRKEDRRIQQEVERQYQAPRLSWLDFVLVGVVVTIFAGLFNMTSPHGIRVLPNLGSTAAIPRVTAAGARAGIESGETLLVDARPSNFHDHRHVQGAVSMPAPLFDIVYMLELSDLEPERPIVVHGRSISARYDLDVAGRLLLRGHRDVRVLEPDGPVWPLTWGGLAAARAAGYQVAP